MMHRSLDAIGKGRRDESAGWGRTKRERERRREERRSTSQVDERMVVDDYGTVRNARDYKGNLEEGLARFEERFGGQIDLSTETPGTVEWKYTGAVPDYARWVPPAADAELPNDNGQIGMSVPLTVMEKGVMANHQNEPGAAAWEGGAGAEESCAKSDCGLPGGSSAAAETGADLLVDEGVSELPAARRRPIGSCNESGT